MIARRCAAFAVRHPLMAMMLALGCCLLASFGIWRVQLVTHIGALLPAEHPALERFLAVESHFGAGDTLGLVVRPLPASPSPSASLPPPSPTLPLSQPTAAKPA